MISGGRIDLEAFKGGWAIALTFGRKKAHYFEGVIWPTAICGTDLEPFMHIGDFTACKRCVAKHGQPSIQEREIGRNAEAEFILLRHIEQQKVLREQNNG